MNTHKVGPRDTNQMLMGGGCIIAIPILLGAGLKMLLGYANSKEHQMAHQVEEVELEGEAAAMLDEGMTPKQALERFVKKLERVTGQFEKMGARFEPADFDNEKNRLELLQARAQGDKDPECDQLIEKARLCLQRFAPN